MFKHKQYDELKLVFNTVRKPIGLWGYLGIGKSYILNQIGTELGFDCITVSCGPTTTIENLVGYDDINGKRINKIISNGCQKKCFIILDEADLLPQKVFTSLNDMLQDRRITFDDGTTIKFNPECYIHCTANTDGIEQGNYSNRNKIDVATLSRFFRYKMYQDERLELDLVKRDFKLVRLIGTLREESEEFAENVLSMRQTIDLGKLQHVMPPQQISNIFFTNGNQEIFHEFNKMLTIERVEKAYTEWLNQPGKPKKFEESDKQEKQSEQGNPEDKPCNGGQSSMTNDETGQNQTSGSSSAENSVNQNDQQGHNPSDKPSNPSDNEKESHLDSYANKNETKPYSNINYQKKEEGLFKHYGHQHINKNSNKTK